MTNKTFIHIPTQIIDFKNRKARRILHALFLLFFIPVISLSQPQQNYENPIVLNKNNGLDAGQVRSVTVDKNGFLWIGGSNGLQRFDGHGFKKYTHDPLDSLSIPLNNISHLFYEEEKHQIWIAYYLQKGLSILDLQTETFKNFTNKPGKPGTPAWNRVYWSFKDKFNNFWISNAGIGLVEYLPERDIFHTYAYESLPSESHLDVVNANTILGHSEDQFNDSLLWLGSLKGLLRFNVVTHEFIRYPLLSPTGKDLTILTLFHHADNQVYVGTWHNGMYRFDPATNQFFKCRFAGHSEQAHTAINSIYSITPISDDRLMVKSRAGFAEYDTETQQLLDFKLYELGGAYGFSIDFKDKRGREFVWKEGSVLIFDPLLQQVKTYRFEPEDEDYNFITRRILEDEKTGKLWLAPQMSKGLHRLDLSTDTWEVFPPPKGYFKHKKTFECWDVLKTKRGELLVVEEDTIYQFLEKENRLTAWEIQPEIKGGEYRSIMEDRRGDIWVGTKSEGVFRINPNTKTIQQYKEELMDEEKKTTGDMWHIREDRNGNVWMTSRGYSVYDVKRDTFYNFPFFHPKTKQVYHIAGMAADGDGNIWVAGLTNHTFGNVGEVGATDADHPEKGITEYFDKKDGIRAGQINDFFPDKNNNIWLVSNRLEKISPDRKTVQSFSPGYLGNREYFYITELLDGRVVMGCRKGIGMVDLEGLVVHEELALPYVQNFKVFDKEIHLVTSPDRLTEVYLKPNENFFSFEISALNPTFFGNLDFQYQLEGVDPEWVDPGRRRYVSYTKLGSGSYNFKLKVRNNAGVWNETPYELRIHIASPWYRTWWAYSLGAALLFGVLFYWYRFQLDKKLAHQEAHRLKELDTFKTRFYANITHEFRTPLTVISGMAEALKNNPEQEREKKLDLIKQNSQRLLALVNQMLDLSKLQAGKMSSHIRQSDMVAFLKYLTEAHESYAKTKNVGLQFYSEAQELLMDFDANKMEQVLNNLISNAIKFTPEYGKILVVAKPYISNKKSWLEIKIKDTGIGISEEQLPHIFDRFHQANPIHENQGSGIGLSLVKELMENMNGKIMVESDLHAGTIFTLHFPISNHAPRAETKPMKEAVVPLVLTPENTDEPEILDGGLPILLIIEDSPDVTYYLRTTLENDYQIVAARNGKKGVEKALDILPDVIICDVMMPEMDGYEVCATLKTDERTNHIPIILLTAKATPEDKLAGLSHGADAYLIKPFEKEELIVRLENLMEVRRTLQRKYSSTLVSSQAPENRPLTLEEIFLQKIENFVLANLENEDFSVHELSRELFLSRSQVHRKIKALTGLSTAIYIRHVRLEKAKELLATTGLSVSEIAYHTGFKTPVYFSQMFKEVVGVSPTEWRGRG